MRLGGIKATFYLQGVAVGFRQEEDEQVESLKALFQVRDVCRGVRKGEASSGMLRHCSNLFLEGQGNLGLGSPVGPSSQGLPLLPG